MGPRDASTERAGARSRVGGGGRMTAEPAAGPGRPLTWDERGAAAPPPAHAGLRSSPTALRGGHLPVRKPARPHQRAPAAAGPAWPPRAAARPTPAAASAATPAAADAAPAASCPGGRRITRGRRLAAWRPAGRCVGLSDSWVPRATPREAGLASRPAPQAPRGGASQPRGPAWARSALGLPGRPRLGWVVPARPQPRCTGAGRRLQSPRGPNPSRGLPSSMKPWERARKRAFPGTFLPPPHPARARFSTTSSTYPLCTLLAEELSS